MIGCGGVGRAKGLDVIPWSLWSAVLILELVGIFWCSGIFGLVFGTVAVRYSFTWLDRRFYLKSREGEQLVYLSTVPITSWERRNVLIPKAKDAVVLIAVVVLAFE